MKILIPTSNYPEKYWLSYDHEKNIDHLEFLECRMIPASENNIKLSLKKKVGLKDFRKFDYLFSDGPDLVSLRLVDLINSSDFADDVQFVPCELLINGEAYSDYFIVNFLFAEPAFDMENSLYRPLIKSMPDGPKKFQHIKLLNRKPNRNMFRAAESNSHLVVSDEVAVYFRENSVVGVDFVSEIAGL